MFRLLVSCGGTKDEVEAGASCKEGDPQRDVSAGATLKFVSYLDQGSGVTSLLIRTLYYCNVSNLCIGFFFLRISSICTDLIK